MAGWAAALALLVAGAWLGVPRLPAMLEMLRLAVWPPTVEDRQAPGPPSPPPPRSATAYSPPGADLDQAAQRAVGWTLQVALSAHARVRAASDGGHGATPREIAAHQVASRPGGENGPVLPEATLLAAMLRAAAHPPDQPVARTPAGLAVMRRQASVAAALLFSLPEALTERIAMSDGDLRAPPDLASLLGAFVDPGAATPPSPFVDLTAERTPWRWLFFLPALATLGAGLARWRFGTARATDEPGRQDWLTAARAGDRALRDMMNQRIERVRSLIGVEGRSAPLSHRSVPPIIRRAALNRLAGAEPAQSTRIDARRSVRAIIRGMGVADPVFRRTKRLVGYVVLVHRRSEEDHERHRIRLFLEAIRAAGIPVAAYEYHAAPLRLWEAASGRMAAGRFGETRGSARGVSLDDVCARHAGMRLVLATDGRELVAPLGVRMDRRIAAALRLGWRERMILTPVPPGDWGAMEYVLSRDLAAPIGRAGRGALDDLASSFGDGHGLRRARAALERAAGEPDFNRQATAWLRSILLGPEAERALGADRLLSRGEFVHFDDPAITLDYPPPQEAISGVVMDLQRWLGPLGFAWHGALAHYPDIRLDLTLHMAERLTGAGLLPLQRQGRFLTPDGELAFQRMSALPWFRSGRWPIWLRQPVLDALDEEVRRQSKAIVADLFATQPVAGAAAPDPDALPIWWPRAGGVRAPRDAVSLRALAWPGRDAVERAWSEGQRKALEEKAAPAEQAERSRLLRRTLGVALALACWGAAAFALWPEEASALNGGQDWDGFWIVSGTAGLTAAGLGVSRIIGLLRTRRPATGPKGVGPDKTPGPRADDGDEGAQSGGASGDARAS